MGVSAKLLINARNNPRTVQTLLESGLGLTVTGAIHNGDHSFLRFEYKGEARQMYVAHTTDHGGLDATLLSLGSNDNAIELLTEIAKVTGGMLNKCDYTDDWKEHQDPHSGCARFVFEHAILQNAQGRDEKFTDRVKEAVGYTVGGKKR